MKKSFTASLFVRIFFLISLSVLTFSASAQKGKNGAFTTSISSSLNDYTALTADAVAGTNTLTVANTTLSTNFASPLAAGDLLFIIQVQGATISTANDTTYGGIISYNNCGNFEFVEVASVLSANIITTSCDLEHNYSASGRTQVVRVPRMTTLTIGSGGSITCPAWNGTTGGVIVLEVDGAVTINTGGTINANAKGFRGGQNAGDNNTAYGVLNYVYATNDFGSEKGESIAGYQTDYDAIGGRICKGAPANGGGGGNAHNAGGGGGGNCGPFAWTGRGNPDVSTASWANAWNLEYTGFASSVSSGGGKGGYSFSGSNLNALTVGPTDGSWGGDARRENGGRGGRPLDYTTGRIFFGGGGGAGDQNNSYGGAGGAGGGLVYLLCYSTISGSGQINANGQDGFSTVSSGTDGAGGGGAGGTVFLDATGLISGVTVNANGGDGGDQNVGLFVNEAEGPGGAGGGGYIAISGGAATRNANGGANGTTNSSGLTEFPPNGATKGGVGLPNQPTNTFHIITSTVYICPGTSTTLSFTTTGTVPPGTVFNWYSAAVGGTILGTGSTFNTPVLSSGQITYYVGSCPGTARFPVQVQVATVSSSFTASSVCTGTATVFTGTGSSNGGAISIWDWDFGNSNSSSSQNPSYTYPSSGTYTVTLTVTDVNGCTASSSQSVVVSQAPVVNFSTTTPSGCLPLNAAFTNTTTNATTYTWDFGDASPTGSGATPTHAYTASGVYTVTLTATNGSCTATSTQTNLITVNAVPHSSFSAPATTCLGDPINFSNLSTPNGAVISGYSWNFGDASALSTATNPSHTYTLAGTYNVVLTTNSASCSDDTTISVVVSPAPVVNFSTATTSGCAPLSVSFSNTTTAAPSYTWNFGDATPTSSAATPTHVYSSSGTYTVTLIATLGTCADTLIRTNYITVSASPLSSFATNGSVCLGDSTRLTNSSTGSITSYTWDFDDGNVLTTASGSSQSHLYSSPGTYNVHLTVSASGCTDDTTIAVNVAPGPVVNFTAPTVQSCGAFTTTFNNTTTGTPVYSWNFGDATGLSSATNPTHTYSTTGTYTVTLIATQGSCADTLVRTNYISVYSQPLSSFSTASVCLGDSVHFTNLSSSSVDPITSYTWNYDDGNTSTSTQAHLYASSGTYNVLLTVNTAHCSDDTTIAVTVAPGPIAAFNASTTSACGSLNATFNNTTTGTPSFIWNFGDGSPTNSSTSPSHTYSTPGSYTVTLIASQGTCSDTITRTNYITVYAKPLSSFSTASVCLGDSAHFTNISSSSIDPITSYTWNYDDGNTSTSTQSHLYANSGTYNVLLTVNTAHCSDDTTIALTVAPGPVVNFSSANTSGCGSVNAVFANATGGSPSYSWNFGDGSPLDNSANPNHNYSVPGNYTVTLIASQGSCADTLTRANYITVFDKPLSSFSTASVCIGDSVHFANLSTSSVDPITSFTWDYDDGNTSAVTGSHYYATSGTYQVQLTVNNAHCSDDTTIAVTVSAGPIVNFSSATTIGCGSVNAVFTNTTTGSPAFTWNFGDGSPASSATSPTHLYNTTGTYTVTLIASQGSCGDTLIRTNYIQVNSQPHASFSASTVCQFDSTHFTDLSIGNGSPITTYNWNYGDGTISAITNSHYYNNAGTYSVVLSVANANCSDDTTITVTVNANPNVNFSTTTTRACDSLTAVFTNTTSGGATYLWDFGDGNSSTDDSPTHTYNTPGTYSVLLSATSTNGCSATKAAINLIIIKPTPVPVFAASRTSICPGDCISFADQTAGTNTIWQWQFTGANPGTSLARNPASVCYSSIGDYSVTLTVSNGSCTATSSQAALIHVVNCSAKPEANFISSDTNLCGGSCISFVDLSLNSINWQWQFPGATPSTSTLESPSNICYTTSGVYPVTLISGNTSGYDTLTVSAFINVSSPPAAPSFTQFGNVLTCTPAATYQWYFNNTPISGANAQQYNATLSGLYSVVITDANGCSATSPRTHVSLVGVEEIQNGLSFMIYPNPTEGVFYIHTDKMITGNLQITLYDLLGQQLIFINEKASSADGTWKVDLTSFAAGIYQLRLINDNRIWQSPVVKGY
jgi:PKD repeat protein